MKNKLLCCLLSAVMLCSAVSVFDTDIAAAAAEQGSEIYGAEELGLLRVLGIVGEDEEDDESVSDEEFLTAPMTRGEFFRMVCGIGGYAPTAMTEKKFRDLELDNENAPYINTLYSLGLITGSSYGQIYPNNTITVQEAASLLVKVLGYGIIADEQGGYPTGYMKQANRIELFKGLTDDGSAAMTSQMAVVMLSNALDTDMLVRESYGEELTLTERGSLLNEVFHIWHVEDVLTGVDISRLMGANDVGAFRAEIGGVEVEIGETENIYDYLGYRVDLYYEKYGSDTYGTIVYINKSKLNTELDIKIEDINSVTGNRVSYTPEDSEKEKKASFRAGAPVLYNGVSTRTEFSMDMLSGKAGIIRLLDNDGDGTADIIIAEICENYVVGYADTETETLYDKFDNKRTIKLDIKADDPYTVIYGEDGEETTFRKITDGAVVSVYKSASDAYQQYIRAYINTAFADGVIDTIRKDGRYIVVDGTEYRLSDECRRLSKDMIRAGAYVRIYFDRSGSAVYLDDSVQENMKYAYIMGAKLSKEGFDTRMRFKLFTQDGEFIEADTTDKLILDDETVKYNDDKILNALHKASEAMFGGGVPADSYSSLVRYTRNSGGKISIIDTVLSGKTGTANLRDNGQKDRDALFMIQSEANHYLTKSIRSIGPQVTFKLNAPLICYPSPVKQDTMDESLYSISPSAYNRLSDNTAYALSAFYTDEDEAETEFMGIIWDRTIMSTVDNNTAFSVVKSVMQTADKDDPGQSILCLELMKDGKTIELPVSREAEVIGAADTKDSDIEAVMSADELRPGDVIFYGTDADGQARYITLYYRVLTDTMVQKTGNDVRAGMAMATGLVFRRVNSGYYIYYTESEDRNLLANITTNDCQLTMSNIVKANYYRCIIGADNKVRIETADENAMKSYRDAGLDCARVLIQRYVGRPKAVMIIEKEA